MNNIDPSKEPLERSVKSATNTFLSSTAHFHFSSVATKEYCALQTILKLHWYFFERFWSANTVSCFHNNVSKIFDSTSSILTEWQFSLEPQ